MERNVEGDIGRSRVTQGGESPIGCEGEKEEEFLRKLEKELLHTMSLRGIYGITKVYERKENSSMKRWDDEKGFERVSEWVLDTDGINLDATN